MVAVYFTICWYSGFPTISDDDTAVLTDQRHPIHVVLKGVELRLTVVVLFEDIEPGLGYQLGEMVSFLGVLLQIIAISSQHADVLGGCHPKSASSLPAVPLVEIGDLSVLTIGLEQFIH